VNYSRDHGSDPREKFWDHTESRRNKHDKLVDNIRWIGVWVMAAIVLLPPYLLGVTVVGGAALYICIMGARRMGIRSGGLDRLTVA
jgi:hypothetical protein